MKRYQRSLQIGLVRNSDIGKEMTLRNANEHKRLAGHLKDLDSQLHDKLVSMQAEMMELKASPYGSDSREKSVRFGVKRERTKSDYGLRTSTPIPRVLVPTSTRPHNLQERHAKGLLLPEIDAQQTCLVGNSSCPAVNQIKNQNNKNFKQFLELPSSLPSVYRPSSLPDLRDVGFHRSSPKATRKTLLGLDQSLEQSTLMSADIHTSSRESSCEDMVGKLGGNLQDSSYGKLLVPDIEYQNDNDNNNDVPQKEDQSNAFQKESGITPDITGNKNSVDFDDVIDKRLSYQKETPSADEMRKVRYLRLRKEEKSIDLVDAVFENRD